MQAQTQVSLNARKLRVVGKRAATADLEQCHSCRHLEEEVQRLQADNSKLRTLNMRLQEQLLDRLSQAGMQATCSPPLDVADQDPWSPPCSSLQEDTYALVDLGGSSHSVAVPAVPAVPTAPAAPASVATASADVPAVPTAPAAPASVATASVDVPAVPTAPAAPASVATASTDVPAETAATAVANCSFISDGQVHLANGVLLQRATYDQLMGVQKDSHFVKRAAVAIWSSEVLAQRSFTGTLTNRFVVEGGQKAPQQPLTPHKVDALRGE
ncbi:uncharacterized protein LOC119395124 [Rhipicephalus sanguineus]|uniref:uncharacterized protein LOC119395124 n=1 Tax=Rhipicephalus sanguineus TaxID=34632 RepID=UPI0020C3B700|nr:uncharacterized protein LOC119395124 [Rhipicephalus sanguineus]